MLRQAPLLAATWTQVCGTSYGGILYAASLLVPSGFSSSGNEPCQAACSTQSVPEPNAVLDPLAQHEPCHGRWRSSASTMQPAIPGMPCTRSMQSPCTFSSHPSAQSMHYTRIGSVRSIQGFARIAETEKGMTKFTGFYGGGFYINNVQVPGSVLASHDTYMLWRPRCMEEVTPESLVFLELIRPAPQVLVLGCGMSAAPVPGPVSEYLKRLGVSVEVLDSRNATGYYNVLNDEGRSVVGALLVMDPTARVPEGMPEVKDPMWDRPGLLQQGGRV